MENIISKRCPRCKKEKPIREFYKNKSKADGLTIQCKVCTKQLHHETYLRNKEKICEQSKLWRINNRERYNVNSRKRKKKYRLAHPERKGEWIKNHPHKTKEYTQVRRARLFGNGNKITSEEWKTLLDFYGHKCLCCGKTEKEVTITLDHVVPISKGGLNIIGNAQPLCLSCNSKKNVKTIDYRT